MTRISKIRDAGALLERPRALLAKGPFQSIAGRTRSDTRRSGRATLIVGAALGLLAAGVVAALASRGSGGGVARVVGATRERASSTVHDARDRFSAAATKLQRAA
ncbi:MAG: hypothetical protein WC709_11005 [Thermoleophilia bacterium]